MAGHPDWARDFVGGDGLEAIARAVAAVEARTSAEIRVHLERHVHHPRWAQASDALARAREVFAQLDMHRTAGRNGVLVYVAVEDRRLAVVGDEGIHARVGDACWARARDLMVERLREGRPRDALVEAVSDLGAVLARHFPRRPDDRNELPDRVTTA